MTPRQRLRPLADSAARGATRVWRRLPIPPETRGRLSRRVVWRPGLTQVPIDKVLLGGQNGLSAGEYVEASGDLLWASRRVADGPHADLLRRARNGGLDDATAILDSAYGEMARTCARIDGHYFGAADDAGILEVARSHYDPDVATEQRRPAQSEPESPILLAPVRDSDCFQVVDGHHRVGALSVGGADLVTARLRRRPVATPLQELLGQMSWIGGKRELYQPIEAPELEQSWTTVRGCRDRLDLMDKQLADLGLKGQDRSYLDVACAYGWFVAEMARLGFASSGIDRDPLAARLGVAAYGVPPERLITGDVVDFLREDTGPWDVVSCFSLLHHFVLGRASVDEVALLRLLDRATGRVLFLDTGQAHEAWFRRSLPDWDTAYVQEFLTEHSTFDRIVDLGPDRDAVAPYADNYGRHLFACIRDS